MVASGDVWLELDPLAVPVVKADIAGCGMRVPAEVAQHFGVFFVSKGPAAPGAQLTREQSIAFFLQKPSPQEIYRHAAKYDFYVDTGLWLFSASAVEFLFRRCGWNASRERFATKQGHPDYLDLYTEIGSALGERTNTNATLQKLGWSGLRTSVIPLDDARFFHVGSSRQLLESYEQLAATSLQRPRVFSFATTDASIVHRSTLPVWVDNAGAAKWTLDGLNVVTGSAPGQPPLHLATEQCVEIAPVDLGRFVIRPYLLDDSFRGSVTEGGRICNQPAAAWLKAHGFAAQTGDVFDLPIYPVLRPSAISQAVLDWFFAHEPDAALTSVLQECEFVSARSLPSRLSFQRYFRDRERREALALLPKLAALRGGDSRVMGQDFSRVAALAQKEPALRQFFRRQATPLATGGLKPEHGSRLLMAFAELSTGTERATAQQRAHATLQEGVLLADPLPKSDPRLALKEDQIVWSRSPVRFDLAGGWTDTPPYCLEHGGAVVNMAVLLNGQPPIQVFVRPLREPVLSLKSIDLGVAESVATYQQLGTYRDPRSGFSLPKAALAMAGFHPAFATGRAIGSLRHRLTRFGGGLEISLLSAVPKGSGLGTSSILAATILGALNRACQLGWDEVALYNRVLGVEQLLTTGGGWQDQAGALFRGIKLVETRPGRDQTPSIRYLPSHLFAPPHANRTLLLYYTGITRLAKGILKEIVHDMFLGRFETLQTLSLIRANAHALFTAIQQSDRDAVNRCIARSWDLNKRLDPGTTTPAIEAILARCGTDLAAAKLLGAGGGGYILLCAKNPDSGDRLRRQLEDNPPNPRARFIDFEIAEKGLEVTVS
jgi:galactokinase/mevalonate kinase-like predicted kinase